MTVLVGDLNPANLNDSLVGGSGDDTLVGLMGHDSLDGGSGIDTVDYSGDAALGGSAGVFVSLGLGQATDGFGATDSLVAIENAIGTDSSDTLMGNGADNVFRGLNGDDLFGVGGGNDSVDGGGGTDTAQFFLNLADYDINVLGGGRFLVADKVAGREGTVTTADVELFSFADVNVATATLEASATVYSIAGPGIPLPEGSAATFVVTRSDTSSSGSVKVMFGGAAQAGTDFTTSTAASPLTLNFDVGEVSKTVVVTALTDGQAEGPESLTLTLAQPSGVAAIDANASAASATIVDSSSAYTLFDPATMAAMVLVDRLTGTQPGVSVDPGSISYTGVSGQASLYQGALDPLVTGGILLTTGSATPPETNTGPGFSTDRGTLGDADVLAAISAVFPGASETFDANVLSFSFVVANPAFNTLRLNAIFASDEYPEFVNSFVDTAVVLVNGVNYALFANGGSPLPLSPLGGNLENFRNNALSVLPTEYDGVSLPLTLTAPVHVGVNTIKIAIADATDSVLDSALYLANFDVFAGDGAGGINEAPSAVLLQNVLPGLTSSAATPAAIKIADISVTDDGLGTNSLGLAGADAASFEIVDSVLYLKAGTVLDGASTPTLQVVVTVDDAAVGSSPDASTTLNIGVSPGNAPPTGVSLTNAVLSFDENTGSATDRLVGTIAVADDGLGTNVVSLSGADAAAFAIVDGQLVIKSGIAFDFESKPSYTVAVSVDDTTVGGSPDATTTVTVTVNDVNEAPVIGSNGAGATASVSVSENTSAVTTVVAADPDAGTTLTYAISGGADAALFQIDATAGVLRFVSGPNAEAPADSGGDNVYDVVVRASDGVLFDEQALAVSVTNVNEAPVISSNGAGATAAVSMSENATGVTTVVAADPDAGTTLAFAIVGGADASSFQIEASTGLLRFVSSPNFETPADTGQNNVYDVIVWASDGTLFDDQAIAVTVSDVNEAPTALDFANSVTSIAQTASTAGAIKVADLVVTDDALGTETLALTGADAASFEIVGSSLYLKAGTVLNTSIKASYSVGVTADDATVGATPDVGNTFTLTVTGQNQAPTAVSATGVLAGNALAENTAIPAVVAGVSGGIKVADLSVTDDGFGSSTLSLGGADAASFEVRGGALYFVGASPNFETQSSYAVTINADDPTVGGTPDASTTFTLTVSDVNEAPTALGLANTVTTLAENTAVPSVVAGVSGGLKVADLVVTDDALGTETFSLGGADAASFEVRGGALFFVGASPNFETQSSYEVTINADDPTVGGTPDASTTFSLTVTDVNEAPTALGFANSVTSIAQTASTAAAIRMADLVVTDDALGTETLALTGADAASFEIVGSSLFLKAGTVLNTSIKASYSVGVTADDATVGATPDVGNTFTLTVTGQNQAPTAVSATGVLAGNALAENTAIPAVVAGVSGGIKVADLSVTDDGFGSSILSLGGTDAASFEVRGGALYFVGASPNFEAQSSYAVTINADDPTVGGTPDASTTFTLTVSDVNEAPTGVSATGVLAGNTLAEGTVIPTVVPGVSGGIKVADIAVADDALGANVLGLTGADSGSFELRGMELYYVGPSPQFETKSSYAVTVTVDDAAIGATPDATTAFTLSVGNVNNVIDPAFGLVTGYGGPAGFGAIALGRNDDQTTPVALNSIFENGLNFFGTTFTQGFLSNNGRLTFAFADGSFTPSAITGASSNPQIAAFFADIDTRGGTTSPTPGGQSTGSNLLYVAYDIPNDRVVFTWDDVGYFPGAVDKLNAFQLILTDRSSTTGVAGDFDITFRYEAINWTTGQASGGSGGLGGTVARAGFSSGSGVAGSFFELPASGDQQAILDLETTAGNTGLVGIWQFSVRNGAVNTPPALQQGTPSAALVEATPANSGTSSTIVTVAVLDDGNLGSFVTTGWTQLTASTFSRAGLYGTALLDTAAGTVTYTLDNANATVDGLLTGEQLHDVIGLSVTDGFSTIPATLDFTINGATDTNNSGPPPGTTGDDTLSGVGGEFTLAGVAGNDVYIVDSASDLVTENSADGTDTVYVRTVASYVIPANVEVVVLGAGTTSVIDSADNNSIFGNDADNTITLLNGGNDTVVGGAGADTIIATAGTNELFGNEGADSIAGGSGDDKVIGGTGDDTLVGGAGNDVLWGESGADSLSGGDGDDILVGGAGADTLAGGSGNDSYTIDTPQDVINADPDGIDTVHVSFEGFVLAAGRGDLEIIVFETGVTQGSGNDVSNKLFGNAGDNILIAGGGNDTVVAGDGADSVSGGADQDLLFGQGGNDTLDGGDGFDQLVGGAGADLLFGGAGADTIWGEDGADRIVGGAGNDHLIGGSGADTFVSNGVTDGYDVVFDYNRGEGDALEIHAAAGSYSIINGAGFVSLVDIASQTEFLRVMGTTGDQLLLV